ncbi:MAG: EF-hand domain-containing protein [Cohaesibacter sp.]|jgi:hypothetical protein|nr:EF-hand domain-containing protein [Cohaesibacter sp.]
MRKLTVTTLVLTMTMAGAIYAAPYDAKPLEGWKNSVFTNLQSREQRPLFLAQTTDQTQGLKGRGMGQGQGRGMGRGQGGGQGQGGGKGRGQGRGGGDGMPAFIAGWDANEDGIVALDEAKTRRADMFEALDDDKNGILNAAEFAEFLEGQTETTAESGTGQKRAMIGMTLAFNDANGDGAVTKEEFLTQTGQWLARMDRNGDGKVMLNDFGRGHGGQGQGMGRGQGGYGKGQGRQRG